MTHSLDPHRVGVFQAASATYDRASVEDGVASVLLLSGLETEADGERGQLASLISPGDTVLLKPNMIRQSHLLNDDWDYVITHGEVIRAVALLAAKALCGRGRLVISDGPQTDSDFDAVAQLEGLERIGAEVHDRFGVTVEVLDLREERWIERDGVTVERQALPGDPAGYVEFDLGADSYFTERGEGQRYYGADYDSAATQARHTAGRHVYRLAATPIRADVFINLPKMKTHKKTGVTLSLKNLVGIHGNRNYLPHHTMGTPAQGGDESPDGGQGRVQSILAVGFRRMLVRGGGTGGVLSRFAKRIGYRVLGSTEAVIRSGNWYGNDTTWRMVLDLNRVLLYGRPDGTLSDSTGKRYLTIVDGIIAGEGNGPMAPDPVSAGLLVAGFNPVAVDTVCTAIMGFDPSRLPMIARAWESGHMPLVDFSQDKVEVVSNSEQWAGSLEDLLRAPHLGFRAHFGWVGHIERG